LRGLLYEPEDETLDGTAALRPRRNRRTGSTFIELQVALVVFSIAVAGLCPLVVMQSRLIRKLETQAVGSANPQLIRGVRMRDGQASAGQGFAAMPSWTVLQPQPDDWVRRLSVAATFRADAPAQTFTPLPVTTTVDDADASFSAPPAWRTTQDASANSGSYHILAAASTQGPATWTFSGLTPGRYHINVSWVPSPLNATKAIYTFSDAAGNPIAQPVNQKNGPGGDPPWTDLGIYYLGTSFLVSLGAALIGSVQADAVQLVPAGPLNTVVISTPAIPISGGLSVKVQVNSP
jgi:Tfp pilus assembly protein PilV